jgi:hypothetical protein
MWNNSAVFTIPNLIFLVISIMYILVVLRLVTTFINQKHYTWLLSISWLLWVLAASYTAGFDRFIGAYAHIQTFANDLNSFKNVGDMLTNYVSLQPSLDIHGQHYPPGFLILLKSIGIPLSRCLIYICGMLSIAYTYKLVVRLGLSVNTAFLSSVLVASAPGLLIFSSLDIAPIILLLSLLSVYNFINIYNQKSITSTVLFALCFSLLLLFSFIISVLVLFLLIYIFYEKKQNLNWPLIKSYAAIAFVVFAFFYLLYTFTGFNIYTCFITSVTENIKLNKSNGFDDISRYLLRSSCNILQFTITCGAMFFLIKFKSDFIFFKSIFITITIAAFSGLFFCETERSWLLLMPFVAIISAQNMQLIHYKKIIIVTAILISTALELFFNHFI